MTIVSLFLYIGIVALGLTALLYWIKKGSLNLMDSFLQNFCGALFVFSGIVKAIDPVGTAYKMEQYFAQFETTFAATWMKFLAPLFPLLSKYSISFSVFMIVLEIVLGIMLLIGAQKKLTAWLFFLIMIFFTFLTGYTYLTAYVPEGVNFFDFSHWGPFKKSNMQVTDCGCFGDFLKLEPKISFRKDLVLMIPAILFLFRWNKWHELFTPSLRNAISAFSIIALSLFSISNYKWNEPIVDFRPFRIGVNIREQKEKEEKAAADVKIIAWKLKNKASGKMEEIPDSIYMKNIASYPKTEWEFVDQIQTEPSIPHSKISDFSVMDAEGNDLVEDILNEKRNLLVIISPKVKYHSKTISTEVVDSVYRNDTLRVQIKKRPDSLVISKVFVETKNKTIKKNEFTWDQGFLEDMKNKMLPLVDSCTNDRVKGLAIIGGLSEEARKDLQTRLNTAIPFYDCDDIVLKTIMRSNPGLLLIRDGQIIDKWHIRRLPEVKELTERYLTWDSVKRF